MDFLNAFSLYSTCTQPTPPSSTLFHDPKPGYNSRLRVMSQPACVCDPCVDANSDRSILFWPQKPHVNARCNQGYKYTFVEKGYWQVQNLTSWSLSQCLVYCAKAIGRVQLVFYFFYIYKAVQSELWLVRLENKSCIGIPTGNIVCRKPCLTPSNLLP
jgi:hypothetical protein